MHPRSPRAMLATTVHVMGGGDGGGGGDAGGRGGKGGMVVGSQVPQLLGQTVDSCSSSKPAGGTAPYLHRTHSARTQHALSTHSARTQHTLSRPYRSGAGSETSGD